jgi:hypothetical protein
MDQIVNHNLLLVNRNFFAIAYNRHNSFKQKVHLVQSLLGFYLLRDSENRIDESDGEDAQRIQQQAAIFGPEVEKEENSYYAEDDEVENGKDVVEEDFSSPLRASFGRDVAQALRNSLVDLIRG